MSKENKKAIKEDIKTYTSLEALKNSEGGQILMKSLKKDIVFGIDEAVTKFKTASHTELIAILAKVGERLNVYRSIDRSLKNKKLAIEVLLEEDD